jgi:hypothetical protein
MTAEQRIETEQRLLGALLLWNGSFGRISKFLRNASTGPQRENPRHSTRIVQFRRAEFAGTFCTGGEGNSAIRS